ncbi:7TM-DISM domain-containing protein, partial [bacterium]|nr:7TM-DISM domain-containing protein [bacterium]
MGNITSKLSTTVPSKSKIIVFFIIVLFFISCDLQKEKQDPVIKNGQIDLSNWDYETIKLNGKWLHFPNKYKDPSKPIFSNQNFGQVPGYLIGDGFDTYQLRIITSGQQPQLAIKIGQIYTSYTLFVNGKQRLSAGITGTKEENSLPGVKYDHTVLGDGKVHDITLYVANYSHTRRGIRDPIEIGKIENIKNSSLVHTIYSMFLMGAILTFVLQNIFLFFAYKKDKSTIYFALLCIPLLCFIILHRSDVTVNSWFVFFVYVRILHLAATVFPILVLRFIDALYDQVQLYPDILKRLFNMVALCFTIINVIAPIKFLDNISMKGLIIYLLGFIALVVYSLTRATLKNLIGAKWLLAACFFIIFTFLVDLGFHYGAFYIPVKLTPLGLFSIVFAMS